MTAYQEKLLDPRWQKKRLEVFERAGFKCQCCGRGDLTLHVHHLVYLGKEPWETPDNALESLCSHCHEKRTEFDRIFGRSLVLTKYCFAFLRKNTATKAAESIRLEAIWAVGVLAETALWSDPRIIDIWVQTATSMLSDARCVNPTTTPGRAVSAALEPEQAAPSPSAPG